MGTVDDEARRLRHEEGRLAELRRKAAEAARREEYLEEQARKREYAQQQQRAKDMAIETAAPIIKGGKLRELLEEVRKELWKGGSIREDTIGDRVELVLEYGPYERLIEMPDSEAGGRSYTTEEYHTDAVGFEIERIDSGIVVRPYDMGGRGVTVNSEEDYSKLRSTATRWLADDWNKRGQVKPRRAKREAWWDVWAFRNRNR